MALLVLFIAPLSGPGAFAVLPPLLLRAALARRADRGARLAQVVALGAGAALQIGVFFTPDTHRTMAVRPLLFASVFAIKHVVLPLGGLERAAHLGAGLRVALQHGATPLWAVLMPASLFGALLAAGLRRRRSHVVLWLVATGIGVATLSYYGALDLPSMIDDRFGARYAFVPAALFGLGVLALAATGRGATRMVAAGVTAWILLVGIADYRDTWPLVSHGPSWHGQIRRWSRDPSDPIALWPNTPGWTLRLPERGR